MQTIDIVKHLGDFRQMIHTFMLKVGVLLYVTYNQRIIELGSLNGALRMWHTK